MKGIISKVMDNKNEQRILSFDFLRVIASFAVIVLHVSAKYWYYTDVNGFEWQVLNFFDSSVRWCVPIFLMISGSLFLSREIPLKRIRTKYVIRLAVSFFVWSIIYAVVDGTIVTRPTVLITGHYHMSFILFMIVIYFCVPLLRYLSISKTQTRYFLLFSFVFAFLIPEIIMLLKDFGSESVIKWTDGFNENYQKMNAQNLLGYIFYFVLGHYIHNMEIQKRQKITIYILGIIGLIFTIVIDLIVAIKTQEACGHYYSYCSVNVLFISMAIFIWFKNVTFAEGKVSQFTQRLAKYSYGVYLVHPLVMEQLDLRFGINSLSFNPIFSVIIVSFIVFCISYSISAILNHIPIINHYIV